MFEKIEEKLKAIEVFEEGALSGEIDYDFATGEILNLYDELKCLEA